MYTVIRTYTGAPGFADELTKNAKSIETELSSVPGFVAYYMLRTNDGATSITVCDDKSGCDESTRRAADWIKKNLPNTKVSPPQVTSGEVAFKFMRTMTRV